jgi:fructoselysine-6-P-deglycase FrlB-like protein
VIDRASLLVEDAERSGGALDAVLAAWDGSVLPSGAVRFVGLGSSRFAALLVAESLLAAGRVARVDAASGCPAQPIPGETVFAVSASGRTTEVVEAARALAGSCPVVAVTNDPASPLAAAASRCLALRAGTEASGIATLTFRATVAALALETGAARREDLATAIAAVRAVLLGGRAWIGPAADQLDAASGIDVIAGPGHVGAAEQAALMLREAPRLRAVAYEAAEWLHTGVYTALPGHALVVLPGAGDIGEIADTVRRRGGTVVDLAPVLAPLERVAATTLAMPLATSVAVELLAAELWRRAGRQEAAQPGLALGR